MKSGELVNYLCSLVLMLILLNALVLYAVKLTKWETAQFRRKKFSGMPAKNIKS